jgi:hypothetical protein
MAVTVVLMAMPSARLYWEPVMRPSLTSVLSWELLEPIFQCTPIYSLVWQVCSTGISLSIGERLFVQSARELYIYQIAVERQEVLEMSEEEREALAHIYEAKGMDRETARRMAEGAG